MSQTLERATSLRSLLVKNRFEIVLESDKVVLTKNGVLVGKIFVIVVCLN